MMIIFINSWGQKQIFQHPDFKNLTESHKTLAILPFQAFLEPASESFENISEKTLIDLSKHEGFKVQEAIFYFFNNKKNNKKLTIEFQDINLTNKILNTKNINFERLPQLSTKELCEILNVDGVIIGSLNLNILISEDVNDNPYDWIKNLLGKDLYGSITFKLSDKEKGKLLWKYVQSIGRKNGKNTEEIVYDLLKKIGRKFPYTNREI